MELMAVIKEGLAAAWNRRSSAAGGRAEHDARHIVSCEHCPQTGRAFATRETQTGHERVMLLINSLWREQFQGDLGILGKSTAFKGFSYTVIGAMPNSFPLPVVQTLGTGLSAQKKP
jgi:hypothetical protein